MDGWERKLESLTSYQLPTVDLVAYLPTLRHPPLLLREKNGLILLLNSGDHAHDPLAHPSPDNDFVGRFLQA
jgi:hypothetical protein